MMKGFTAIVDLKSKSNLDYFNNIYNDEYSTIRYDNAIFLSRFNNKFKNDKIFNEDEDIFICTDGVILNFKDLRTKHVCSDNFATLKKLYNTHGISFVKQLRGNFTGIVYDKRNNKYYFFTNHLGTKHIYYFFDKEKEILFVSSSLKEVTRSMKKYNYNVSLDETGTYFMLTCGYMLYNYTTINDVKRISPGSYLMFNNGELSEVSYYYVDNTNYIIDTEDNLISELHERFSHSVKLAYDKDLEYNYRHVSLLSGGLDSRIISFYANKMGYKDVLNLTFSQNGYLDEKIAKQISSFLNNRFLFHSLNNGNYLRNIQQCVSLNEGQMIYSGAAHAVSINNLIDWKQLGMLHNGNVADVMHGDYVEAPYHTKPIVDKWSYSNKLLPKIKNVTDSIASKYENHELFAIYNRGINGMLNGSVVAHDLNDTDETFLNFDMIEYSTRIHPKYKYREYLFLKMIEKYMPDAANFKWEKWNLRPNMKNYHFVKSITYRGFRYVKRNLLKNTSYNSMNPFDYWFKTNNELREYINNYFNENIHLLDKYSELKKDCIYLFNNGVFTEKAQVITVLEGYKQLIEETK